jgi:hypothetical protein
MCLVVLEMVSRDFEHMTQPRRFVDVHIDEIVVSRRSLAEKGKLEVSVVVVGFKALVRKVL